MSALVINPLLFKSLNHFTETLKFDRNFSGNLNCEI